MKDMDKPLPEDTSIILLITIVLTGVVSFLAIYLTGKETREQVTQEMTVKYHLEHPIIGNNWVVSTSGQPTKKNWMEIEDAAIQQDILLNEEK